MSHLWMVPNRAAQSWGEWVSIVLCFLKSSAPVVVLVSSQIGIIDMQGLAFHKPQYC